MIFKIIKNRFLENSAEQRIIVNISFSFETFFYRNTIQFVGIYRDNFSTEKRDIVTNFCITSINVFLLKTCGKSTICFIELFLINKIDNAKHFPLRKKTTPKCEMELTSAVTLFLSKVIG